MKTLLYSLTSVVFLSSCSHKISRVGYNAPTITASTCQVEIKHSTSENEVTPGTLLGEIKLGDTGFSTRCNEDVAMDILKKEACALNANMVVITDYSLPSLASTCYRCSASFYKVSADSLPLADSLLQAKHPIDPKRNYNNQEPNIGAAILGYTAGFVLGYLLVSLLF